ncbi:hypothetical protein Fcan01_21957 [Folsomia candida]|uniref:Uncharacterized protein n=1 Tax=Folsomia candida TaxID=158441 RepID=A0A226DDJ0_FOLCA|nr:hypothetical protein Fcan01_21957 [Folsomia candida]
MVLDVDHEEPTAFYDCPGFGDTRSVTVEIANAYYMKKVADHGQNIKIIIIALHPDFDNSYRDRLPQLFKKLVQFIRNVDHYSAGFSFIVNKKDGTKSDQAQINTYRNSFLNLRDELENFDDWTAAEKLGAQSIIDAVVQQDVNTSKIWFFPFPEPRRPGSLESFQNLMEAKDNISELIWGKSQYIVPTPDRTDFGFSLTADAILKLIDALIIFDQRIFANAMQIRADTTQSYKDLFDEISRGDYTNFEKWQEKVLKLNSLSFPVYIPDLDLVDYMREIVSQMTQIVEGEGAENLAAMVKLVDYLKFMLEIEPNNLIHVRPMDWVGPFMLMKESLTFYAGGLYQEIRNNTSNSLLELTPRILSNLSDTVSALMDVADQQIRAEDFFFDLESN